MALKIQFLGQPRILLDGQSVDLPGYRPLALLAYLVLARRAYSREHLIDLLFDGPDDPRAALRWTLSKLRTAIGSEYILTDRQNVSFNFQSNFWLDVAAFETGETDLYQGDFLEGLYLRDAPRFEDWQVFERQRLRSMYQDTLEKQLEGYKQQADQAGVIITAQQLLKLDNLREDWHFVLINAYAQLGKRATALEQYEKLRLMMRKEWGADPSPQTIALAEAIQKGQTGVKINLSEIEFQANNATLAVDESFVAPDADPEIHLPTDIPAPTQAGRTSQAPRFSKVARTSWLAIGVFGLFIVSLLVVFNRDKLNSQTILSFVGGSSGSNSEAQPEPLPQEFAGKTVSIMGSYREDLAELFNQSMIPLEERTGIKIEFVPVDEAYLAKILEIGEMPDILMFPQPGRVFDLAKQGLVIDLRTFLDDAYLRQQYPESFISLATLEDHVIGAWFTAGLKSLVWYPRQAFDAMGYQVPETWDELIALSDQIVAGGGVPWCIGIESADATGWVATDWVEDILLRTAPPETYDAWVNHDLPFNSPEIRRVFEIMGQIWLNEAYVYGGVASIAKENILDSTSHLFDDPPGCYLHRQGSFAPIFFPSGVEYEQDYDFFYLPPIDPEFGKPVLGSGDILAMLQDRPEVREVMRYLTTPEAAKVMIQHGGYLSPYKNTPLEWFPTPADLRFAQIVLGADTYRFDGSDRMPEAVGYGSFFRGITKWLEGEELETVLQEIDDSWPREE